MPRHITPITVFLLAYVYAAVRYVVIGSTDPGRLPVFVTNKACGMAVPMILAVAVVGAWRAGRVGLDDAKARSAARWGLSLAGLHVLLSLMTWNNGYYSGLVGESGRMSVFAEGAMLCGAVAAVLLPWRLLGQGPWPGRGVLLVVAVLVFLHTGLMGWSGWMAPWTWRGWMPPPSAIGVVGALLLGVAAALPRRAAAGTS